MSVTIAGISAEQFSTLTLTHNTEVADQISKPTPLADMLLNDKEAGEDEDGGKVYIIPFKYQRHSTGIPVRTGFESANLNFQPTITDMQTIPAVTLRPAGLGLTDDIYNRGKPAIIKLALERSDDAAQGQLESLEQQWLQSGTYETADFTTLNGADDSTGLIEAAAVGAQGNTVQGISKATYQALPGMQNQFADAGGVFSTAGVTSVDAIKSALANAFYASRARQRAFCTEKFSQNWSRALETREQYVNSPGTAQAGKEEFGPQIEFLVRGIRTRVSRYMPTTGTATTGKPWSWLVLDLNMIKLRKRKGFVRQASPWVSMQPAGSVAMIMWHVTAGQLAVRNWETSAVLVDGDDWS